MSSSKSPAQQLLELLAQAETLTAKVKQEAQEAESKLESLKQKFAASSEMKKIKLDVGGTTFSTSLATLTSEQPTFFSVMFSEAVGKVQPDADGTFFIDRNPKYFGLILDHLRGVKVAAVIAKLDVVEQDLLLQELEFYQIESLINMVLEAQGKTKKSNATSSSRGSIGGSTQWHLDPECKHPSLVLSNDNLTVCHPTTAAHQTVIGNQGWNTGKHVWKYRVDATSGNIWHFIGVCDKSKLRGDNYDYNHAYGITSDKQMFKMTGVNGTLFKANDEFTLTLDCDAGELTIVGHDVNVSAKGLQGTTWYPIVNLYAPGNKGTVTPVL